MSGLAVVSLFSSVWSGTIVLHATINRQRIASLNLCWFAASVTGFVYGAGWLT